MRTIKLILAAAIFTLATTSSFSHNLELNSDIVAYSQDREEIAVSDLPSSVTEAIEDNYADFSIEKAFKSQVNDDVVYHVLLSNGTENMEVTFDADGNKV